MTGSPSRSTASAVSTEHTSVGLRRSLKYSFYCLPISPVKVNKSNYKWIWWRTSLPLLRHRTVCQNIFEAGSLPKWPSQTSSRPKVLLRPVHILGLLVSVTYHRRSPINQTRWDSFFSLMASITSGVQHQIWGLLAGWSPETSLQQHWTTASTVEHGPWQRVPPEPHNRTIQ